MNLYSWLFAVIDVCYYDWCIDIFKKGNNAFDFIVEFMVADCLCKYYKILLHYKSKKLNFFKEK